MGFIKATGIYKGIIVNTNDPSGKFHRVQVRIPKLHGPMKELKGTSYSGSGSSSRSVITKYVYQNHLPWCEVIFPYGSEFLPEVGQVVAVAFFNGDTSQPVVVGWLGYEYTDEEPALETVDAYGNN